MSKETVQTDLKFMARRQAARQRLDDLTGAKGGAVDDRLNWFHTVYQQAGGDAAAVPWADLAPKQSLLGWLESHPGKGQTAIDIGCGLGDNAEALAETGYETTAFDLSPDAIAWAQQRFPTSSVNYRPADLFDLPKAWLGTFDLVHECYTIQALDGDLRTRSIQAIAGLVAPGGTLLMINRSRDEGCDSRGPPWPIMPLEWRSFECFGLTIQIENFYEIERPDRKIPHVLVEFKKTGV